MSNQTNIQKKMAELRTSPSFEPFSRVTLWYDDEHYYTAGNDSGRTLEADCPWATQAMVNNILSNISGFVYRPYEAEDAILDPAAEIGDGIGVNTFYSILASALTTFDIMCTADISAPADEEIDHEFPYKSPIARELERKVTLGGTYYGTRITRANGLEITKTDGNDEMSRVILNSDTLAFYNDDGTEAIYFDPNTEKYTFNGTVMIGGSINIGDGNFTVDENGNVHIPNGSISFNQLDSETQETIEEASEDAADASQKVSGWVYPGTTYIDSSKILVTTLQATELKGGSVSLINRYEDDLGTISIGGSQSSDYQISLESTYGAMTIEAGNGSLYNRASNGDIFLSSGDQVRVTAPNGFIPNADNSYSCGASGFRWSQVYAATSTISTSDRQKKKDISYDMSAYEDLYDALKPTPYKFIDGTSGRTHIGFISQDIEQSLGDTGLDSLDFAGFIKSRKHDEGGGVIPDEYDYALRYEEFIALNTWQIQKLKAENEALKARLDRLEALLNA